MRRRGQARYAEYHLGRTKANSQRPLLPPLGEVPRSGKGGGVGNFETFPFNEPHPLSQPCRFRSAVKSASSPIGEPSLTSPERGGGPRVSVAEGFAVRRIPFRKSRANPHNPRRTCLRIRLGFHRTVGAYCETPQSAPFGLPAPLSGALFSLPPFGGGAPRPCCPLWGKCREAAKGVPLVALSCFHSTSHTPSVSLAGSEVPSSLPAPPSGSQEIVRIRLRFHKTVSACCNPSAAAAAAQLCIKRLYAVKDGYTR